MSLHQDGGAAIGGPHRHFRLTDSTNERAKALAEAGAPGGLIVTADEQTAGRGRQGRAWFGHAGSTLLYSALLRPLGDRPLLPLAMPLAVCTAAEALAPVDCRVKWPNDVWIEDRKLAGVLVEGRPDQDWAVIGVGLNVDVPEADFPDELRETATSLTIAPATTPPRASAGPELQYIGDVTLDAALGLLNTALEMWLAADERSVLAEFRRRDALVGRRISWTDGGGVAAGIDDDGHLLVDTDGGERTALGAGEVHLSVES